MTRKVSCVAPIVVRNPDTGLRSEVRCGQCRSCRLRRKLAWAGRLIMESKDHKAGRFITLTYAEDPGILDYRHFQLFMKRYRKEYGDVRFFAVGEYGKEGGRGHYHAIIFGSIPGTRRFAPDLQQLWERGYCYDGSVTKDSIGYVSGYVFKENYSATKKPFVQMSLKPGIGMDGLYKLGERTGKTGIRLVRWPSSFTVDGKSYPLCDGGLAKFQTAYLESGGLPPPICNPMDRHLRAIHRDDDPSSTWGRKYESRGAAQISKEHSAVHALMLRYEDDYGQKKER